MDPRVDQYIEHSARWSGELSQLRKILLECGLVEEIKWGAPTYRHQQSNIAILGELKACCVLSFFKGVLLEDRHRILVKPGANTRSARIIRFTKVEEIIRLERILKAYIREATEVERAGLKVLVKNGGELIPEEFQRKLDSRPALKEAFEALTAGRQRGYLLYFSSAKQSRTREERVMKWVPHILKGKGLTDR